MVFHFCLSSQAGSPGFFAFSCIWSIELSAFLFKEAVVARIVVEDWLTDDGLRKLELYKRRGMSDKQIAQAIGISERTFTSWKKKNPAIVTVLKKAKEVGIDNVELTMFDKALGYTDKTGEYHPPETTAGIFILKNMRRHLYRDKPMSEKEELKLDLETERIRLDNEVRRRLLEGDGETDKLKELIRGLDTLADET